MTLPPKRRPAGVAASAAVRAVFGVEALAGHVFGVGSWIEVRDRRQGKRAGQFERVRVYQSDDKRATRVELAGELAWIDLDEWEVRPAPALPTALIAFDPAYTGQMPTDAAAYASHLSAAFVGMDCTAYATWTVGSAATTLSSWHGCRGTRHSSHPPGGVNTESSGECPTTVGIILVAVIPASAASIAARAAPTYLA